MFLRNISTVAGDGPKAMTLEGLHRRVMRVQAGVRTDVKNVRPDPAISQEASTVTAAVDQPSKLTLRGELSKLRS